MAIPISASDSHRRAWLALTMLALAALAYAHYKPGQAYPLAGLWAAATFAALLAGGGLLAAAPSGLDLRGLSLPALPLCLFAGWAWLRTAFSTVPSEGSFEVGTFILGIATFWLGAFLVRGGRLFMAGASPAWGERLIAGFFAALAVLFAAHAILEYHWIYPRTLAALKRDGGFNPDDLVADGVLYALRAGRVSSRFGNPNVFCGFLAMCLPLLAAAGWEARGRARWAWRVGAGAGILALVYAAFRTGSAGGGLVLIAGVALTVLLLLLGKRPVRPVLTVALATGLFFFFQAGVPAPDAGPAQAAESDASATGQVSSASPRPIRTIQQRLFYLRSGVAMWLEKPLFGHGAGAYGRLYPAKRFLGAGETRYAHNFVVQMAVETGLLGLALFFWLIVLIFRSLIAGVRSGKAGVTWQAMALALFLFLLDSLGDYTFYVREVYLDFCLILGAFFAGVPREVLGKSPQGAPGSRKTLLILMPALGLVLVLAALWRVIVPGHMAAFYRRAVEDVWKDLDYAVRQGIAVDRDGLRRDALKLAGRAVAWDPSDPWLYQLRGHAYGQTGRPDAMRLDLRKAVSLHPDSASLRADLAAFEWGQGNRQRAQVLIGQAIPLYPLRSGLHEQRARYLAAEGRREEALAAAREAARVAFTPREKESSEKTLRELEAPTKE